MRRLIRAWSHIGWNILRKMRVAKTLVLDWKRLRWLWVLLRNRSIIFIQISFVLKRVLLKHCFNFFYLFGSLFFVKRKIRNEKKWINESVCDSFTLIVNTESKMTITISTKTRCESFFVWAVNLQVQQSNRYVLKNIFVCGEKN